LDPDSPSSLPPSLLSSLSADSDHDLLLSRTSALGQGALSSLASPTSPDPSSVSSVRSLADQLLLEATAPAIRSLARISTSGSDKDQLAAASLILSKSPATKESLLPTSGGLSLNSEALSILLSGLNLFAKIAQASDSQPPDPTRFARPVSPPAFDTLDVEIISTEEENPL
jgi:hypothetical protein